MRSRSSRQRSAAISPRSARRAQLGQDAIAHLGGGLARERDREDVARIDAASEQRGRSGRRARASCPCRPTPRARRDSRIDGEVARRLIGRRCRRPTGASNRLGCIIVLQPVFLAADAGVAAPWHSRWSRAAAAGTRPPRSARRRRRTATRARSTAIVGRLAPAAERPSTSAVVAEREVHRGARPDAAVRRAPRAPAARSGRRPRSARTTSVRQACRACSRSTRSDAVVEHVDAVGLAADLDRRSARVRRGAET